jgi:OmpA-OmpF porin, OOP family
MRKIFILAFGFCSILLFGQNSDYKHGLTFRKLFIDYQSQNGGALEAFKDYSHGFEIGYQRPITSNLNLVLPFKYGVASDYNSFSNNIDDCYRKTILGMDVQGQYLLNGNNKKINPFVMSGLSYIHELPDNKGTELLESKGNLQFPVSIGMYIKLAPNAFMNIQSEYRFSLAENRNNLIHGLGFSYLFGGSTETTKEETSTTEDKDKDGVDDKNDLCPDIYGLALLKGCPDKDGDGVADYLDACMDLVGLVEFKGCPDTDGDKVPDNIDDCPKVSGSSANKGCPIAQGDVDKDGVPDKEDKCPDIPGIKENMGCPSSDKDNDGVLDSNDKCPDLKGSLSANGCPDKDNDGIADKDDKCPNSAGSKIYGGCPDTDGDGLDDSIDKCPNTPGTVAMNGCPEIDVEDKKTLDIAMRAVQFETGKAVLKSESFTILNQIASILSKYPDYNLIITGHTDNQGDDTANQVLSEKRAKACYEYLFTEGIDLDRMSFIGAGESKPVSSNETPNGRSLNRRVEFSIIPK